MNRLLKGLIALMLPAMVGCGTAKVQDVPEEIYACPMPSDLNQDEPEEDVPVENADTLSTNK